MSVLRRITNPVLHPPLKVGIGIVLSAVLLFIIYFQFFFGPIGMTLFVLAFVAYAALIVYEAFQELKKRSAGMEPRYPKLAAMARRADIRKSAMRYGSALMCFLFVLFCLISGITQKSSWYLVLAFYNQVLLIANFIAARELQRSVLHPLPAVEQQRHEARIASIISTLLIIVSLIFSGIAMESILRNRVTHYPNFVLAFQVLFTALRLAIVALDAFRFRREGSTIEHVVREINLCVALCAVYTTQATFLARFCPDEWMRLLCNLITSFIVFYSILRISAQSAVRARNALKT